MKKRLLAFIFIGTLISACLSGCGKQKEGAGIFWDVPIEAGVQENPDAPRFPGGPTLEQAIEAYAAYPLPDTVSTYHLAYIDEDDIPECIFGGEKGINGLLTFYDGTLLECWTKNYADKLLYDEKARCVCFYSGMRNNLLITDVFDYYQLGEDGTFENVGYACYRAGEKIATRYDTYPRRNTTEETYEKYKSRFGELAVSIDAYEEMYESVEKAYEVFQAQ